MTCDICNFHFPFWAIFCLFTPLTLTAQKIKISKKWKKKRLQIFHLHVCTIKKFWLDDVRFLRYGAWQTDRQMDKKIKWHRPIDRLHLFWFSWKIANAHVSGRQNKNKPKEKHAESSEHLVNRVSTSLYASFVSVEFEKNMPDSCTAFGCTNHKSTTSLQFYCIPSGKRYPEQGITKWVTAKNDWLRK